jgi:hypothetical protein
VSEESVSGVSSDASEEGFDTGGISDEGGTTGTDTSEFVGDGVVSIEAGTSDSSEGGTSGTTGADASGFAAGVVSDEAGDVITVCIELASAGTGGTTGGVTVAVISAEIKGSTTVCTGFSATEKDGKIVLRTSSTTDDASPNERGDDWIFVSAYIRFQLNNIFEI